tara:strand:- start:3375 stop:4037 length:663 start_codon:yes stop_codon:yes gene_type:complete
MLGTDGLGKHAMKFGRECAIQVKEMIDNFELVENWCHVRNRITIRWLKWLGFKFEAPIKGKSLQRFYMTSTIKAEDWEMKLNLFFADRVYSKFEWGKSDCCMFMADAVMEMTGVDVGEFFRGKYSDRKTAFDMMKKYSGGSIAETLDKIADVYGFREIDPSLMDVGDIATIRAKAEDPIAYRRSNGIATGISLKKTNLLSAGLEGLTYSQNPDIVKAWRV